jgi:hypothetical protein
MLPRVAVRRPPSDQNTGPAVTARPDIASDIARETAREIAVPPGLRLQVRIATVSVLRRPA